MRVLLFSLIAFFIVAASSNSVQLRYFNTENDAGVILVTWEAEQETDVKTYELFRKPAHGDELVKVAQVPAHGEDVRYFVRDDKIYKSSTFAYVDYRLEAVLNNGVRLKVIERQVNYTSTAIRRSWGSIKAMFRN